MINHDKKIIFVHIPKTGGTSIESLFCASPLYGKEKHLMTHEYDTKHLKLYFKFSFVRNPWDRSLSYYFFRLKKNYEMFGHGDSFLNWIKFLGNCRDNDYKNNFFQFYLSIQNQSEFIFRNDYLMVDYVGKFENLQQDFNAICDKAKMSRRRLPHKNKSNHKHYTEYYDDETRQIVAEKYAKDIEYFGYEFGD